MQLIINASPDEYVLWLETLPDDAKFASKEFGASDIEIDPIATFLKENFELFGYSWLENKKGQFRALNCEWGLELTFELPDWMSPLICIYHGDPKFISKTDAKVDLHVSLNLPKDNIETLVGMAERKIEKLVYETKDIGSMILTNNTLSLRALLHFIIDPLEFIEKPKRKRKNDEVSH